MLQDILVNDLELDLTGWVLREARGISAVGQTIVGFGTNPDNFTEGWIATIPEVSGDFNSDGNVDLDDLATIYECTSMTAL